MRNIGFVIRRHNTMLYNCVNRKNKQNQRFVYQNSVLLLLFCGVSQVM